MKPHPRIRRTIKWGGAALTALFAVTWVGSGWWGFAWIRPHTVLMVGSGQFEVDTWGGTNDPAIQGWQPGSPRLVPRWWNQFGYVPVYQGVQVRFPLWCPLILSMAVTAAAWRLDIHVRRRERSGRCPNCHYDRTGLAAAAVCPECGAAAPV
jgi:hypothetical protein